MIRPNVTYVEYCALPGKRVTALRELGRSAKHYLHRLAVPKRTKPLALGTAAHVATLEPDTFDATLAVWGERSDGGALRPRRGKDYDAFVIEHAGQTIITEDEYTTALAIQRAVRADPNAMRYLAAGQPEVSMVWVDAETGIDMKGRVDWMPPPTRECHVLAGLKTCRDIRTEHFGKQAANLGYALAWAAYHDGYQAITGESPKMVEVVVESAPPYDCGVYVIPSDILELGRNEYRDLLAKLRECEDRDEWPGALPVETRLAFPPWAFRNDEDEDVGDIEGLRMRGEGYDE